MDVCAADGGCGRQNGYFRPRENGGVQGGCMGGEGLGWRVVDRKEEMGSTTGRGGWGVVEEAPGVERVVGRINGGRE